jgi:inner membrane protein
LPTIFTHVFVAGVGCKTMIVKDSTLRKWSFAILCSVIPDADVIGFGLGIDYGAFFGHRGFFHSVFFALILSLLLVLIFYRDKKMFSRKWWEYVFFFFTIGASHGIMDAFTNGGLGIALLSPFYNARLFFPWTPIPVSPIGVRSFILHGGFVVVLWEMRIVWLPILALTIGYRLIRPRIANKIVDTTEV